MISPAHPEAEALMSTFVMLVLRMGTVGNAAGLKW
jgi:hypothetical protein